MKLFIKNRALYEAPEGTEPPPFWIRALLVLTCTGVSFAHGSNDGQKGMGLIMLILIGTVPTAYALNHAVTKQQSDDFIAVSQQAANTLNNYVSPNAVVGDAHEDLTEYIRTREFTANTTLALRTLVSDIGNETALFGELSRVPNDRVRNFRNDSVRIRSSVLATSPGIYSLALRRLISWRTLLPSTRCKTSSARFLAWSPARSKA